MTPPSPLDGVTCEIAGLTCRLECALPKPLLWISELHPAFRSSGTPELVVTFRYEDGYWTRGLPWIAPDQVVDAPSYTERAGEGVLHSTYYDAVIDAERRRVRVRLAFGFGAGNVVRALCATVLPDRGACLVRATVEPMSDDGARLVCGADDGLVALVAVPEGVDVVATPFHAGTTTVLPRRRHVRAIVAGHAATGAALAAAVLARVVTVDHSPRTLDRVLGLVARLIAGVQGDAAAVEVGALRA